MKNRSTASIIAFSLVLMTPNAAPARPIDEPKYDNNCVPYTPEEQEIKKDNILLVIVSPVMNAGCRGVEKFRKLIQKLVKKKDFDPDKIDADDVFDGSKPDVTNNDSSFGAKLQTMPSPTKNPGWNLNPSTSIVVLPPNTAGGVPVVFQPNAPSGSIPTSVNQIGGTGTLITAEGMKRGTFKQGKLNGLGEEIDPDGTWRGGTFQNGTNMGYVYEVRTVDGKTYIAAGSVVNGKLDGMIERVYADGSTQYEDWEGGRLMQVGVRAPKGRPALAPQARYKPPVEVATEDAYKKIGPRPKIAPGTTFNPAKTTAAKSSFALVPETSDPCSKSTQCENQPPNEVALLEDIRTACLPQYRSYVTTWLSPTTQFNVEAFVNTPVTSIPSWSGSNDVRLVSSNNSDRNMQVLSDKSVQSLDSAIINSDMSAEFKKLQLCAFHRRLFQVGRTRYFLQDKR